MRILLTPSLSPSPHTARSHRGGWAAGWCVAVCGMNYFHSFFLWIAIEFGTHDYNEV